MSSQLTNLTRVLLTLHVVLHEQNVNGRCIDAAQIVCVTRLAALYNCPPAIVPYIFEDVNVLIYDYNMNINVLDCST